ncbi:maternal effect protein staufen [Calliphora vicina]|uniref:maternal effect protein staufen n=1 Tax=Calliphora vicina TaxID=7373 RepID=UPI00325BE437
MNLSTKPPRLNKVKNRNNQIPFPYNGGIHFLSTSHSGVQINRKYVNTIGNINEVSVLQYHRTSNLQIRNNNEEVNHIQNTRHQPQQYVFKNTQYQNHLNSNLQQKGHPLQRKIHRDQQNPPNSMQIQKNVERGFKDTLASSTNSMNKLINQHTKCNSVKSPNERDLESKSNSCNQILQAKSRKIPSDKYNNEEERKDDDTISFENPLTKHSKSNKVPENYIVGDNSEIVEKQNVEQEDSCNNAHSDESNFEDINENPIKNAREKTPMCLINDLARYNKISFQYRLTSENGPAHCKRFTVTLKLGDEEYTAEGFKIKKAQHLAAKEAIEKTKYKHPTPKTSRRNDDNNLLKSNITPTVELNALAMKLGQQTYYIFDPRQMALTENNFAQNDSPKTIYRSTTQPIEASRTTQQSDMVEKFSGAYVTNLVNDAKHVQTMNQKRQFLSKCPVRFSPFQQSILNGPTPKANSLVSTYFPSAYPCKITLIVGTKKFVGVGRTLQQAKHNAASSALQVIKEEINNEQIENESFDDIDNKSPISLVFEIGIKRNLPVDFKVLREEGPAHMRTFITACIVGDIITEGEGTGKKVSKKKAAQKMLEELNKLPPLTPVASPLKRVKLKVPPKKSGQPKTINLVECKEESEPLWQKNTKLTINADSPNPISKLLEWHHNKKEKEPIFKLISESGKENSRRRQFVMEVTSNEIVARGVGNSKKLAKRDAAHNFLIAVTGSDKLSSGVSESGSISKGGNNNFVPVSDTFSEIKSRKEVVNNVEPNTETYSMHEHVENVDSSSTSPNYKNIKSSFDAEVSKDSGNSSSLTNTSPKSQNLHMKDQLLYLAKLLGFEVDFSDYPKGNHNEFLTIVMLSTNPPQICHGVGINANESQEDAAKNALKILSEMGLNNAVKT